MTRTREALGKDLMKQLNSLHFCIVGCGGTGTTFSEMLVRSGAKNIDLVDGDNVDLTNLNRVFSFALEDVGKNKADILKKRLESITPEINVRSFAHNLIQKEDTANEDPLAQKVRNSIREADVVFIGTDTNKSRMTCESLCNSNKKGGMYLSAGIAVENGKSFFECSWKPKTPETKKERKGYGPKNASYISIVTEATSVAFSMLLHHLKNPESREFKHYYKEYDADFYGHKISTDRFCLSHPRPCV